MALYNNPYQYSFGVPGQMNQFQQQPVQVPAQPVQQPQQNNNGILWVSGEVGAKSYLVAPGTSVLLMDSESEKFYIKSTDVSGNIAIPTGGTVGAISLAIAISGEPVLSSQMISTPAAVDQYNNVSSGIYIDVPRGCCVNIAVENTSDQAVSVANANIVVTREA